MPSRGYRKGISDQKQPRPHVVKSRLSSATHSAIHREADSRSMTFSSLVSQVLEAHATGQRLSVPQGRGVNSEVLRELARVGNNVNQIARQAHAMRLHLLEREALTVLAAVNDAAKRIAG